MKIIWATIAAFFIGFFINVFRAAATIAESTTARIWRIFFITTKTGWLLYAFFVIIHFLFFIKYYIEKEFNFIWLFFM